uniref:DUF295 domain-containing protein n=1 Tax=Setaria viridis TaxID=4556 RepID=A0A4U6W162_SETVI|nr:hypothetical protein SEVIR_2G355200v2 [Setaria viridis]
MEAQGWSSLPADLMNCVADRLLATNDLDYYVDLRAVCHGWRSSTTDPKTSHDDERFHPTRWIVLDNLSSESDDTRLFVNASTGRFLRNYHFVTSTTGGFLVLAEREPPHAARVLNPFTGTLTRFKAPMPEALYMVADVLAAGEMLRVYRSPPQGVQLFRKSSGLAGRKMERVYSIGGRALFVGKSVYYTKEEEYDGIWYMYDLAQDKEERIVESSICIYPASILQLLLEYTMCSPLYQPPWARGGWGGIFSEGRAAAAESEGRSPRGGVRGEGGEGRGSGLSEGGRSCLSWWRR